MKQIAVVTQLEHFICILQKCRKRKSLTYAKHVHGRICSNGLEVHSTLGNHIVPMFVECGSILDAQHVFNSLVHPNEHAWTSLILGYVECQQSQYALNLYQKMQEDHVHPSKYTFMALLKACAKMNNVRRGQEIHAEIIKKAFERDIFFGSTLVDMYANCGSLAEASEVFDKLSIRDVVSWTALIAGYGKHVLGQEGLKCFKQMQQECVLPNAVTYVCSLKACGSIGAINMGQQIHVEIAELGLQSELVVGNALLDMYAKCGSLGEAWKVFDMMAVRDIVSWNTLIVGYVEHGLSHKALRCLEQMRLEGVAQDSVTFISNLKACGVIATLHKGREIHAEIADRGFEPDVTIGSALVDMYAKCGSLAEAQKVFDKLLVRDVFSWNALIAGYAENEQSQEALKCLEQMQVEGISPDAVTFVCSLKACGILGTTDRGREIHDGIVTRGVEGNLPVGNALITMYAKCGSLREAQFVFSKLPGRNVVSWSAMINVYGMNHEGKIAIQCFKDMEEEGIKANATTFTCLLSACSHAGLVSKGLEFFTVMKENYGITPSFDHYICMIDLLGRSGCLYEADKLIKSVSCLWSDAMWKALLSACKTYGEAELGLRCFEHLVQMNAEDASAYVLMENVYASAGRWDDADRIQELRNHAGAKKKPASAFVQINRKVHEFMVGRNESIAIMAKIETLSACVREKGHVSNLDLISSEAVI